MRKLNVLICDTGISNRQLEKVKKIDIGLGWKDDNGHGSQIIEVNKSLLNKVSFKSIKILDEKRRCQLDTLLRTFDIITDLDVDLICLALAVENDEISNNLVKCIEDKINKISRCGKIIVSSLHNSKEKSYPASFKNVIGVRENDFLKNNRFYYSKEEIQCNLKCEPIICESIDNVYKIFGGNSMATAFFLSHLSNVLSKNVKVTYAELQHMLDEQRAEDLYFYNNLKSINNDDLIEEIKSVKEDLSWIFNEYFFHFDQKNLFKSIKNIEELNRLINKVIECGYKINKKTFLKIKNLETIDTFSKYLVVQGRNI